MRFANIAKILLISLVALAVTIQAQAPTTLPPPGGLDAGPLIPVQTSVESACTETAGCSGSQVCRIVYPCPNCEPHTQCINPQSIAADADDKCKAQGFREAILFYQVFDILPLPCRGRNKVIDQCPWGSECVDDGRSGGICCIGPEDRCGGCPEGQGCYDRPPNCIPGQPCITAFVPTCVPHQCAFCTPSEECIKKTRDGSPCSGPDCSYEYECMKKGKCGNRPCPAGKWCTYTGTICVDPHPDATPIDWSQYGCFEQYECSGVDLCGGCQDGYECVDTGIRCVTEPCPSYQCKKIDNCFGQCRFNQECKAFYPSCPPYSPRCDPIFECVDLPGYDSCKKVKIHTGC